MITWKEQKKNCGCNKSSFEELTVGPCTQHQHFIVSARHSMLLIVLREQNPMVTLVSERNPKLILRTLKFSGFLD